MNENTSISAGFAASCTGMENDLGNRRSIRLSYGGNGRNPRVLRVSGQCGTRGKREGTRFVSAQWRAQSVHWAFSSRASFSSTASRMNFGRPYVPAILSTRSSVAGANRTGTGFRCKGGRPIRGALSGAVALFKKTILFSVDGLNDAVYVNGIVYGGKTEMSDQIPLKLHEVAERNGYHLEYRALVYRRGWPQASAKPFGLYFKDGGYLASFATLRALENNLCARAGC